MGLLDAIFPGDDDGGLLGFLKRNAELQPMTAGLPSDQADYGSAPAAPMTGPSPAMNAMAQMPPARPAAPVPANPPPVITAPPAAAPAAPVAAPAAGPNPLSGFLNRGADALASIGRGGSLLGAVRGQYDDPLSMQTKIGNLTARALVQKGVDPQLAVAAVQPGNTELLKQLVDANFGPGQYSSAGEGHILNNRTGKVTAAYDPQDKTPQSVLEYQFYKDNFKPTPQQPAPMDYATFSTAKARAGATNIVNSFDPNGAQTYDKQLVDGLGKAHASLANGVEEAQTRARDVAAMQGALDAIQRNGGSTGGMGQQQVLDLKKTINAGATALGMDNPFNEGDISDKEFLTKFNRQMAGNMAKSAVGSRVTNFEMGNYLKANPGLDMSVTGNQRLLGIQAQIEQRNIAVGNAIRQATAESVATGKTINPVQVQKIITDYDEAHHVKDPITGQDLTQSYALPEFQNANTSNKNMSDAHTQNLKRMEKTIGNRTAYTEDGGKTWFWK